MERLTHYYNGSVAEPYNRTEAFNMAKKLADYEDAEEQGLLVRLPCKVGNTVYGVRDDIKQIIKCEITEMVICKFARYFRVFIIDDNRYSKCTFDDIGKTVFFTHEEAEQALEERK